MATRYYIRLPEPSKARGNDPDLAFKSKGGEGFAGELENALRTPKLFERRLRLLAGSNWQLSDVKAA
jgi:hypothetical protein